MYEEDIEQASVDLEVLQNLMKLEGLLDNAGDISINVPDDIKEPETAKANSEEIPVNDFQVAECDKAENTKCSQILLALSIDECS